MDRRTDRGHDIIRPVFDWHIKRKLDILDILSVQRYWCYSYSLQFKRKDFSRGLCVCVCVCVCDRRMDGRMSCDFTSFSTVFQSYQDEKRLIMKGCVQWNPVYG